MIYAINKQTKEHRVVSPNDENWDEEWRCAHATPDGWIEWHGGDCPLPDNHPCEIEFRAGIPAKQSTMPQALIWQRATGKEICPGDITAYRPILDAKPGGVSRTPIMDSYRDAQPPEAPEWDGLGLPPVGCECEVMYCEKWRRCEIIAHFKQRVSMVAAFTIDIGDGAKMFDAFAADCFRPLRSAEDKAVEEMIPIICNNRLLGIDGEGARDVARALYRAGYRKTATADGRTHERT